MTNRRAVCRVRDHMCTLFVCILVCSSVYLLICRLFCNQMKISVYCFMPAVNGAELLALLAVIAWKVP